MNDKNKLLLVDDEQEIRDLYIEFLSQDYSVTTASNGEEGFRLASSQVFDVILLDMIMPELDGIGFLEKKRNSSFQSVPVIAMSNLRQEEVVRKCFELGVKYYISKVDVTPDKLVSVLTDIVRKN